MTIDAAATMPTTTPAAMPATFVLPPLDCDVGCGELEDSAGDAGRVTTTVVPGFTLVTTCGLWVVRCGRVVAVVEVDVVVVVGMAALLLSLLVSLLPP